MKITALIVAAGRGTRAGSGLPKQWQLLRGQPVLVHTLAAFQAHRRIDQVLVVLHADDFGRAAGLSGGLSGALEGVRLAEGGATRDASVRAGLEALAADPPDLVLIHDVARPLVTAALIDRVIAALTESKGAAPALAVSDALWHGLAGQVTGSADRTGLFRAQTPQGFHYPAILAAHRTHRAHAGVAADDVEVARAAGIDVAIVAGDEDNLKITLPGDFARAERLAEKLMETGMDIRVGTGFDVHAFEPGKYVVLCGVHIPHIAALKGHSDADVGMHALTDAIYGALAEGDIGQHFPPSQPEWKGAESRVFLAHASALAARRGYRISNVDVTLICEAPKIGPHAGAMRTVLARILGLGIDRVSVKATTSEQLGFTGRKEGIAAQAVATLVKT